MKKILPSLFALVFFANFTIAQNLVNAFAKEGKVFVQYDNGTYKQIVSEGKNIVVAFSRNKNFVIYQRIEHDSRTLGQEGMESYPQLSIRLFNVLSGKESILLTTCLDGDGGTEPFYGNSDVYPNKNLCGFESAVLSTDGDRLYFQTSGWQTCPAIHYYNLKDNNVVFFMAGWLQSITLEGIEVQITGIETKNNGGNVESKGRYTQYCLFDADGNFVKELSAKEFLQ
ncbi:MAG: hypothetical protein ACOYN4_01785 [Bacteroidales bacterium]